MVLMVSQVHDQETIDYLTSAGERVSVVGTVIKRKEEGCVIKQ